MTQHGFRGILSGFALLAAVAISAPAMADFDGFGKDIPLDSAARQIVPDGWKVDYADGVDKGTTVSWSSSSDWQSALKSAVAKRGYSAQIGSDTVVITKSSSEAKPYSSSPSPDKVQKSKPTRKSAARPAPKKQPRPEVHEEAVQGGGGFSIRPYRKAQVESDGSRLASKEDFTAYKADAPKASFEVKIGQMLQPTLNDWAAAAGWTLVWNSEYDYRIEADASFGGSFVDAVTDLSVAMSDARPVITLDFYKGNNVLVVSNKSADEAN